MKILTSIFAIAFCLINTVENFIPAKILDEVINKLDSTLSFDFGKVNPTLTHEEILRRGIIKSVANYFYAKENGSILIDKSKVDNEYLNINRIYIDYYGKGFCNLPINRLLKYELLPNVAIVDLDPKTKDLPYAHFDAETFIQSNQRVMNFLTTINAALQVKDYSLARRLSGQILHTIQDFYSHSNWIEMGKTYINTNIGRANFSSQPIISNVETTACLNNCTITEMKCGTLTTLFINLIKYLGISSSLSCPLIYYKCTGNIVKLNTLVSGFYTGQKLEDGTPVLKPEFQAKCSHGGILDKSVIMPAEGNFSFLLIKDLFFRQIPNKYYYRWNQ
jgi:hypothetical protein